MLACTITQRSSSRESPPRRAQAIHHRIPKSKKEKSAKTYLPLFHIILLGLILLRQLIEDFIHVVRVGFELRQDVADGALDQHAVDHAEALAVAGQRCEGFEDQSGEEFVSSELQGDSTVLNRECRDVGDGVMLAFFAGYGDFSFGMLSQDCSRHSGRGMSTTDLES